jgi:phage/plasmid-like protein (TIGR03299 family)
MHDLDFNRNGIARFAYRQKHVDKVWHRHGVQIPEDQRTIDEWLTTASMDHTIEQAPLYALINGEHVEVPSHKLVYRDSDNKQLSVMGKDYRPVQTREAFSILEDLVQGGEIEIDTMGTLREGRRAFIAASITGDPLEVVPGDMLERYLLCADSYDGSLALTYTSVATLTVCQNTLRAALNEKGRTAKGKHTSGILSAARVAKLRETLGIATAQIEDFAQFGKKLASIKMSDSEVYEFHKSLVFAGKDVPGTIDEDSTTPQQRTALGELGWLYFDGPGQELEGRAGTAWGALNSVTAWTNHVKNHRRDVTTDRTHFVLYGSGNAINERAKQVLVNQYQLAA